jgi:methyltransferase-like protein
MEEKKENRLLEDIKKKALKEMIRIQINGYLFIFHKGQGIIW